MKRPTSKRVASTLFGLTACVALLVWAVRAQDRPSPKAPQRQYVIACAAGDVPDEIRRANDSGYSVSLVNDCLVAGEKVVCEARPVRGDDEDEGR